MPSLKLIGMKMASFGEFIRIERERLGWTQTEFGAKIGINAFAICKIEKGKQKFNKTKLRELAKLFDTDFQKITDLFFADKFAEEAYKNHCSKNVFTVAESHTKYLRETNIKQGELKFKSR